MSVALCLKMRVYTGCIVNKPSNCYGTVQLIVRTKSGNILRSVYIGATQSDRAKLN